jgi:membrane protein implicated in regulation of membrane protease activity
MENVLLYIAVFSSVIYVMQIIATFMGADPFDGTQADFDSDLSEPGTIQVFTIKNAISFLVGISWGGLIAMKEIGLQSPLAIIGFGLAISLVLVGINIGLFFLISKLERKQVPSLDSALGQIGTVYLTIPESGYGKVTVDVNGTSKTLDASSSSGTIFTGSRVSVIKIQGSKLVVEKM